MAVPEAPASIRASLLRKGLADAAQRAALARRLGLTANEVLAVLHLARAGVLTPGQLNARLQLSSGGTTGLIHRMQRAGHVTRDGHARDGRSAVLRLTPEIRTLAADAWAPLVSEIDSLVNELPLNEAAVVRGFLASVADAAERHANRLAADADAAANDALAVPLPALWA
jgi:DNA-binding MarR family transcriptional regulator